MIELYSPASEPELILLKSIFEDAGIRYFVRNDVFGSLTVGPHIELYNRKTIFVPEAQLSEARALLREYFAKTKREAPAGAPPAAGGYSPLDKLRMVLEVLLFGWIMPGRRRRRPAHLRLVKGAGAPSVPEEVPEELPAARRR